MNDKDKAHMDLYKKVQSERDQLDTKLRSLNDFLAEPGLKERIGYLHVLLLREQRVAMQSYVDVLDERLKLIREGK
jgi:hypothetical protein